MTSPDLQRNDIAMIRQICNVKPENVATVRLNELLAHLEIDDLNAILREKRLRWFGHVEQYSGAIKSVCDGRPKMTWKTFIERDRHEWNLNEVDPFQGCVEI